MTGSGPPSLRHPRANLAVEEIPLTEEAHIWKDILSQFLDSWLRFDLLLVVAMSAGPPYSFFCWPRLGFLFVATGGYMIRAEAKTYKFKLMLIKSFFVICLLPELKNDVLSRPNLNFEETLD